MTMMVIMDKKKKKKQKKRKPLVASYGMPGIHWQDWIQESGGAGSSNVPTDKHKKKISGNPENELPFFQSVKKFSGNLTVPRRVRFSPV